MENIDGNVILSHEDVAGERISVYLVTGIKVDTLNKWSELVLEEIKNHSDEQSFLALFDLSTRGVSLIYSIWSKKSFLNIAITEHGHDKLEIILNDKSMFKAKVAYLFSDTHSGNISQLFGRIAQRRENNIHIQYDIFSDKSEALDWLTS